MKEILLTQNKVALVDDQDFDWLNRWNWYALKNGSTFYALRRNGQKRLNMHRVILGLQYGDKRESDHINHNGLDNRRCNLRIVSNSQNHWNLNNVKGYSWVKLSKKWMSHIKINGKAINLGLYDTEQEAYQAYLNAKKKYHHFEEG